MKERRIDHPLFTFRSWPDQDNGHVYTFSRGCWVRFGATGPGLHYRNIARGGHNPLFTERYGRDRSVSIRVGPHILKLLRGRRS